MKKNTTIYIGKLYECTGSACTKYIFAGSNRIALKTSTDTYYYHTDHLGSSSVMTDAYGTSQGAYYYYPYGGTRVSSGLSIKHKFTGQELDSETGLYYYGARYYDPALGRFVSADSIVQDFSDPQSLNRYSYCRNNPIILTDPNGHLFIIDDILIGAAIGAAIGGVTSAVTGGNILEGMAMGAIGGAFMGAAFNYGFVATVGAGAAGGGVNAAVFGGDIGQGMLYGGIGAAAGYGLGAAVGSALKGHPYWQFGAEVAGGGLISGSIAELSGGNFSQGFASGAIGAAMGYGIQALMNKSDGSQEKQQETSQKNLIVNHTNFETASEWVQLCMGPFGPGFMNIRTTPDVPDVDNFNSDYIPEGYIPARKAIPGELGLRIFRDTANVGSTMGRTMWSDMYSTLSHAWKFSTPINVLPNPRIVNPPVPEGFSGGIRIR